MLLKKLARGSAQLLIKQIIEFEIREPGLPGRTCIPRTGYFYDKTKISTENLRVDYYLLLKYCTRQCTSLSLTWAKSRTKFDPKMQNFKDDLDLIL